MRKGYNEKDVNRRKRGRQQVVLTGTKTTEGHGSSWRLALCYAPLLGMCHRACQQSQQPARSGEGRVTTIILTNQPVGNFATECAQLSMGKGSVHNYPWGKGEVKDAKKERKIS